MSGLIMSGSSIIALFYLLSYLFYLPECVLALTTTIIGITVLQEVPSDLIFYWNIKGFDELATFSIIFLATLFWSAEAGVSFGVIIAIIRIIKIVQDQEFKSWVGFHILLHLEMLMH